MMNNRSARAKSVAVKIAVVHKGSYNAASKIPTTAALIPTKVKNAGLELYKLNSRAVKVMAEVGVDIFSIISDVIEPILNY